MPIKKLIFSADDFGKNELANRNILELLKLNKIDRVAIFARGKFSRKEIQRLLDSKAKLDIHLDLPEKIKGGREVVVKRFLSFAKNYFSGKNSPKKVKIEWENQVEKFKEVFGRYPDGLNSHEHVHFFPPYFKIALEISEKFGIRHVRFGKKGIIWTKNPVSMILKILHKINRRHFEAHSEKLDSTDHLFSLDWTEGFEEFKKTIPNGEIEVVCHPEHEFELTKLDKNSEYSTETQ